MDVIVLKFGGAAFSKASDFSKIAEIVIEHQKTTKHVVIVVSAMKNMTNALLRLSKRVHDDPPKREQDMLVSVGERISMSLLAMALDAKGIKAVSFTGSQSGIFTSADHTLAKIIDVRPYRIVQELEKGNVVIVAGFQGMSLQSKEITTLGRGGSDTTAVALAVALSAKQVVFYKDVLGMYEKDPKKNPELQPISCLHYNEALVIVRNGAQILHERALLLAYKNYVPLLIKCFKREGDFEGSLIYEDRVQKGGAIYYEELEPICSK